MNLWVIWVMILFVFIYLFGFLVNVWSVCVCVVCDIILMTRGSHQHDLSFITLVSGTATTVCQFGPLDHFGP